MSSKAIHFLALLLSLFVVGCGGGGNTTPQPTPTPNIADFTLSVAPLGIQQQGAPGTLVIQAMRIQGFTGAVNITIQGVPAGISIFPSTSLTIPASQGITNGVNATVLASSSAALGATSFTVVGTSGSLSHSATVSLTIQPAAPFHLTTSRSSLSLTPGSQAIVSVGVVVQDPAASPDFILSVPSPPLASGLDFPTPQGFLTAAQPQNVTVNASLLAQPLQNFPFILVAQDTSTKQTSSLTLPLNVSVPFPPITGKTRSTFVRTDEDPADAVYDPLRKLVFVAIENLNEVVVVSSVDGTVKVRIPVQRPHTLDETADLGRVYVGGIAPFITVIDPDLLQVIGLVPGLRPVPATPGFSDFLPILNLKTLSNGKVLVLSVGGFGPFLWDPAAGTFVENTTLPFFPGAFKRSADHTKVVAVSGSTTGLTLVLYDVATNTFSGQIAVPNGFRVAINQDGSQIATMGDDLTFFDSQLKVVGSTKLFDIFAQSIYSLDGRTLYAFGSFTTLANTVGVFDTARFAPVGLAPDVLLAPGFNTSPLAIDETGMVFGAAQNGLAMVDVSTTGSLPLPGFLLGVPNVLQPLTANVSGPTQMTISGAGFNPSVTYQAFIGPAPASSLAEQASNVSVQNSNFINMTVPAGTPGVKNLTLVGSDGWYSVAPDAVSFGPQVLTIAAAGPPAGGIGSTIYGFGFTAPAQVTVGGAPASNVQAHTSNAEDPVLINQLTFTTPPGSPGLADVVITNAAGTITVPRGYQYLASTQVFPMPGALDQIIYDQPRQRLYISNEDHGEVEVFSLATQAFLPPIAAGQGPAGIALTPDGTRLAVVNSTVGTVAVVDPDTGTVLSTFPVLTSADRDPICQGVAFSTTPMRGHKMLVDVNCPALLIGGAIHVLDLDTGLLNCTGITGCDASGTNIVFGTGLVATASTSDGSKILLADAFPGGPLGLLNVDANQMTISEGGQSDAAVNADGNIFASGFGIHDSQLFEFSVPQDVRYLNTAAFSLNNAFGEKLSPSGSLLFVPQQTGGIDVFDVHKARLSLRIGLPQPVPLCLSALALDETGTRMFLISTTGIMIAQLAQSPLSIATTTPSAGVAGTTVTIRGSGFQQGAQVRFATVAAVTTLIDGNTIQAIAPVMSPGPVRVTVTNPDGSRYDFDAAFTVQ